jgi:hypothetical protein
MKRIAALSFGLLTAVLLFAAQPASAAPINVGTLALDTPLSFIVTSNGPTFSQDYDFHLSNNGVTILADASGQTSSVFGIGNARIELDSAPATLIGSRSALTSVSLDSFANFGVALNAGDYVLRFFGDGPVGKKIKVLVDFTATSIAATPIPDSGLLLLTGLGIFGGLACRQTAAKRRAPIQHAIL